MKNQLRKLFFFILFSINFANSQTIEGYVNSADGNLIENGNVTFYKDSINGKLLDFCFVKNGVFKKKVSFHHTKVVVKIVSLGYNDAWQILDIDVNKVYDVKFILEKEKVNRIEEVVISIKREKFTIQDDTTKFNVDAYRDGTERKIEDLIKKLPGIQINEKTGEIKYKNIPIETVKLDGDDLFSKNYTLGTKNINVDMVEQVQALENYSDDSLLKNIKDNENKVALNLKLKKGLDLSIESSIGLGAFSDGKIADNSTLTVLAISKKIKAFGIVSHNNIGKSSSPFNYYSDYVANRENGDEVVKLKKIIYERNFANQLKDERVNINNSLLLNYNQIFKLSKRISLRTNGYKTKDEIKADQFFRSNNTINQDQFITSDYFFTNKKPSLTKLDSKLTFNINKKSSLKYDLNIFGEKINTFSTINSNNNRQLNSFLSSSNKSFLNKLEYIYILNERNALKFNYTNVNEKVDQALNLNNLAIISDEKNQVIDQNLYYNFFKISFIGKSQKGLFYDFKLGNDFVSKQVNSLYLNRIENKNFSNALKTSTSNFFFNADLSYKYKRFKLSSKINSSILIQKLEDDNYLYSKIATINPALTLSYLLNINSRIGFNVSESTTPISDDYLYKNPILLSNRNVQNNIVSFEYSKIKNYGLFYRISNLRNQLYLNLEINHSENTGSYFSDSEINTENTFTTNFYLNAKTKNTYLNFEIEKYFYDLKTNFILRGNFSKSDYFNIVNQNFIQNFQYYNFIEFYFKTTFKSKLNFENRSKYVFNENKNYLLNNYNFINANFLNVIYKINNNVRITYTNETYLPNTSSQKYTFMDVSIRYLSRSKKTDFSIIAKNLTNLNSFEETSINEYSTATAGTNLLPRHILFNFTYSF